MRTTIDGAGRIVMPKAMRQALGLKAGQVLDIRAGEGRLEIEIALAPASPSLRGRSPRIPDGAVS